MDIETRDLNWIHVILFNARMSMWVPAIIESRMNFETIVLNERQVTFLWQLGTAYHYNALVRELGKRMRFIIERSLFCTGLA